MLTTARSQVEPTVDHQRLRFNASCLRFERRLRSPRSQPSAGCDSKSCYQLDAPTSEPGSAAQADRKTHSRLAFLIPTKAGIPLRGQASPVAFECRSVHARTRTARLSRSAHRHHAGSAPDSSPQRRGRRPPRCGRQRGLSQSRPLADDIWRAVHRAALHGGLQRRGRPGRGRSLAAGAVVLGLAQGRRSREGLRAPHVGLPIRVIHPSHPSESAY